MEMGREGRRRGRRQNTEGDNGSNLYGIAANDTELEKKGSHGSDIRRHSP